MPAQKHILGIRHHGPGSARNVKAFLEEVKPDIVLVEGPPDAEKLMEWVGNEELVPPVALLVYQPDDTRSSVFYPFAEFSPEWQAILYAQQNKIHVRFMDLPVAHSFALGKEAKEAIAKSAGQNEEKAATEETEKENINGENNAPPPVIIKLRRDPIGYLAEVAGCDDGEKWWEQTFEHRLENENIFEAVGEAMTELRAAIPYPVERQELLREAYMRKTIRQAEREMFQNIAIICGAWHVPALNDSFKQKDDNELLKNLPKVKTESTWIPWTYNRLSYHSGYGAGIASPGWYDHVWHYPKDDGTRWMAKVAQLFREKGMDTSVAHVIEAVRLAESLASLRGLSKAGLEELNEATLSILCMGSDAQLALIKSELIVSNRIGQVPQDIPKPPLQLDIERQQKKLRLPPSADSKEYLFDLRKENDLEKSIFLHRLLLLEIYWGTKMQVGGKGTFKEQWRLQWEPGFSVDIIEKGNWGNTIEEAATAFIKNKAGSATDLAGVSALLATAMTASLPEAVNVLVDSINNLAAGTVDVQQLMGAVPGLVHVSRYGNVRKTDSEMVGGIARSMITRITVSLPVACIAIDEEAAEELVGHFYRMNEAINTLDSWESTAEWRKVLTVIAQDDNATPVISGYVTRLLYDCKVISGEALVTRFSYSMSKSQPAKTASAWLEGFLKGSGTILLLDNDLWNVIDQWLGSLGEETFIEVLPLLRRTFASFTAAERRKLNDKARNGISVSSTKSGLKAATNFNHERASKGIPVVLQILNIKATLA